VAFEVLAFDVKRGARLKTEQAPAACAVVGNAASARREMGIHGFLFKRGLRVDDVSVDAAVELERGSMGAKGGECGRP
jgi:hypothetical protein